jgi:hypothetical protein
MCPRQSLSDIKLLQKSRAKAAGVSSAPAYLIGSATDVSAAGAGSADTGSADADKFERRFRTDAPAPSEAASLDAAKEQFIKEELAKARAAAQEDARARALGGNSANSAAVTTADTAAMTSAPVSAPVSASAAGPASASLSAASGAASGRSGAGADAYEAGERWLSGIEEVSLPIAERLKNIERTEAAHSALLRDKELRLREALLTDGASAGGSSAHGPVNMSTDFRRHRREWGADARAAEEAEEHRRMVANALKHGRAAPGPAAGAGARRPPQPGASAGVGAGSGTREEAAWLGELSAGAGAGAGDDGRARYERALMRAAADQHRPASDVKALRDFKKFSR